MSTPAQQHNPNLSPSLHVVPGAPEDAPASDKVAVTQFPVSDLRQFKGQIGARVRLGADPATGYVDVEVRVSDTDPRVREHLRALREAFREIAADAVVAASQSRSRS